MTSQGFGHFTLDDLAAQLHCSKTTLYALAPTKQELVVEVCKHYFREAVPAVEEQVEAVPDPRDRVQAYLKAVATYLTPLSPAFMDDLAEFQPAADVYRRNTDAAAARIRELIADGVAAGAFREVHAAFVAEVIAATMLEIQRRERFARLGMSDARAYDELASLVVHALSS